MDAPMSIRKLLIRQAVVVGVVVLVLSIAISFISGGMEAFSQLGWAFVLSAGIAAFAFWQSTRKIRKGFIDGTNPTFALVPVLRETWPGIQWDTLDDYASRLEALGFRRLGEFTPDKAVAGVRGVAMLLSDP